MEHAYCVIMAGGKGERFWPLSTRSVPKPFVKLLGGNSLIQTTFDRVLELVPADRVFVVLSAEHVEAARRELPSLDEKHFVVEPVGRDTAPCIGLAAMLLREKDPEAVMVVLPADHYVPDTTAFCRTISLAVDRSKEGDFLITMGVRPTRPETGYGYIHAAARVGPSCFAVDRFVEKPDQEKAAQYLAEGSYFWNSGIFVWRPQVVLSGIERHMPRLYQGLEELGPAVAAGNCPEVRRIFAGLEEKSIDYGLMEKADNILMVTADFAWDDVGTWGSLRRVMGLDKHGNYASGDFVSVDTENCVICGEGVKIGTIGVSNLIVVASRDGVLVCDLERDQEARQIARMFEEKSGGQKR